MTRPWLILTAARMKLILRANAICNKSSCASKGSNSNLQIASDNLLGFQKEADAITKANKAIPKTCQDDLLEAQTRLEQAAKKIWISHKRKRPRWMPATMRIGLAIRN